MKNMTNVLKKIGTHDGVFHCDEVLACFMLKRLPEYTFSEIIRTRDQNVLDTCDIVVDVGNVYDPEKNRFDHHQKGFEHTMNSLVPSRPWNVKLSSAGLIYHHFGEKILETILSSPNDPELIKNLYNYVYDNLIQEIDGIDNGISMFDGNPKYNIQTHLSARVKKLNPSWNEEEPHDTQKLFHVAMDLVGREFIDQIHIFTKSFWPARSIVKEAVLNREATHESGEIIELKKFCPWEQHFFKLETELNITGLIKFVIFPSDFWRVRAVPVQPNSFEVRIPLTNGGLRNEELDKANGIDGCVFVHSTSFIGGHKTREGAIEMALQAINSQNKTINE